MTRRGSLGLDVCCLGGIGIPETLVVNNGFCNRTYNQGADNIEAKFHIILFGSVKVFDVTFLSLFFSVSVVVFVFAVVFVFVSVVFHLWHCSRCCCCHCIDFVQNKDPRNCLTVDAL